jgi:hypothetical protein
VTVKDWIPRAVERAACGLVVLSFFLPFLTVRSCSTQEMTDYRGYELLGQGSGWIFVFPLALAVLLFALSFFRPRVRPLLRLFGLSWKALLAATAGFTALAGSLIVFMFDKIIPRVGYWLCGAGWSVFFVMAAVQGVRLYAELRRPGGMAEPDPGNPFRIAVAFHYAVAVFLAALPAASCALDGDHDPGHLLWYAVVVPTLPMLAVAALGLRRAERWAALWSTAFSFLAAAVLVLASYEFVSRRRIGPLIVIVPCFFFCLAAFFTTAPALRPGAVQDR